MTLHRLCALSFSILALSACGSDTEQTASFTGIKTVASIVTDPLGRRTAPQSGSIGMTRAALANIVTPVDLVTIENINAQGVIAKIGSNGGVETWSSVDNKTLSMRDGIVVATRGLGADLMSAAAPRAAQLRSGQRHTRLHVLLDGEDKPVTQRFDCIVSARGGETITVVERGFATQRITESCADDLVEFSNDYWFETGGKLRKSRQWISENVGFVVIEHLR